MAGWDRPSEGDGTERPKTPEQRARDADAAWERNRYGPDGSDRADIAARAARDPGKWDRESEPPNEAETTEAARLEVEQAARKTGEPGGSDESGEAGEAAETGDAAEPHEAADPGVSEESGEDTERSRRLDTAVETRSPDASAFADELRPSESAGGEVDAAVEQGLREVMERARVDVAHRLARIDPVELTRKADGDPELLERAETVQVEKVAATSWYMPGMGKSEFADHLGHDPQRPIPIYDGSPRRDQVQQGALGDCGVLATAGAVAGHRPEAIQQALRPQPDGTVKVLLHERLPATPKDPVALPTGRVIELKMNKELPTLPGRPDEEPFAQTDTGVGWPALVEKAAAAQDQAWTPAQREQWKIDWTWNRRLTPTNCWPAEASRRSRRTHHRRPGTTAYTLARRRTNGRTSCAS